MHVDHVREAAQPMQHAQGGPPLEPVLERHQEQQNQREQDDLVRRCLDALHGLRKSAESIPRNRHQLRDCPEHEGGDGRDGKSDQTSKPPDRTA